MPFRFHLKYALATLLLFLIECGIALFVHDRFVRPYIGDVLVVVLIYCFVRTFLNISVQTAAIGVLIFSITTEILQYFHVLQLLKLEDNKLAYIVIGHTFSWEDILCYLAGYFMILFLEKRFNS